MVSVEKWKNHFKRLAHKAFPHEDMYIVAQSGRGIGRNAYRRTLYQICTPTGGSGGKPTIEIVSPVASTLGRAKALTKTIKRKKSKKSSSKGKTSGTRKKSSSKKKKGRPKKKKVGRRKKKAVTAVVEAALAAGARKAKKKTPKKGRRKRK